MQPENARSNNIELHVEEDKLAMPEFKALWSRINAKSVYVVDFDTNELIKKSIAALNSKLHVSKIYFQVVSGTMNQIKSKDDLISGASFVREESNQYGTHISASNNVKYDLVGKLVDETGLTRKAIAQILQGIQPAVFNQFKDNPEEFIIRAADLINDEKATAIIQHMGEGSGVAKFLSLRTETCGARMKVVNFIISKDLLENRIKDGAGLLNPLSYYLAKVGI